MNRRTDRRAQRRAQAVERNAVTLPHRRRSWRRPCPRGKVKYATHHDAQVALVGAVVGRNKGKQNRRETRVYECPECGYHHLTSIPQKEAS